jgi:putative spermidine/putrescine transport system ATP-binding protein
MPFLQLTNVQKRFGETAAVERFDLAVERGEFISFLGPSGCGKTTTLRMIAGFEQPTAGAITIDGRDITRVPPSRRNVGMVFQSYALFPNMSVAQNIAFGLTLRRVPGAQIARRVEELLELIALPGLGSRYPYQLSGGQQQRVALARALAIEPQVLLLDEPLSALDAKIRVALRTQIRAIQRKLGITTIYVTHDQEEALALSDRIVVMNKGRIEQVGAPQQIYAAPASYFVAAFVGNLNLLPATVADPADGRVRALGQELRTARPLPGRRAGEAVTLAVRPESISPNGRADGANRLQGTVEQSSFLGSILRVQVRVADADIHYDTFTGAGIAVPQPGDAVTLALPPEACLVLDPAG